MASKTRSSPKQSLAAGHLCLPKEIGGHGAPEFPDKADEPFPFVGDGVCGTEECVGHGPIVPVEVQRNASMMASLESTVGVHGSGH
jgi:hypothetical protein